MPAKRNLKDESSLLRWQKGKLITTIHCWLIVLVGSFAKKECPSAKAKLIGLQGVFLGVREASKLTLRHPPRPRNPPKMEGRQLFAILAPDSTKIKEFQAAQKKAPGRYS